MQEPAPGKIVEGGAPLLGIPTGIPAGGAALTRLTALSGAPGWRVGSGAVEPWKLGGFLEREGQIFLYGPWQEGLSLGQVLETGLLKALPFLERLVRALRTLQDRSVPPFDLQTDGVIFLQDGGVLFLPPPVMKRVTETRPEAYRLRVHGSINHNGRQGEPKVSFALGALLYRLTVGEDPFPGASDEEVQDRMRRLAVLPPALAVPGLRPEVSAAILRALGRDPAKGTPAHAAAAPPTLGEWLGWLSAWSREGVSGPLGGPEQDSLRRRAQEARGRSQAEYRRRLFWRRHWKAAAIAAAAVLAAGGILASMLGNILAPRSTRGFSPARVVETYYRSMNGLDHAVMEDCVTGQAGKQDINEILHLYVLSRVSLGYEGRSHILPADEWDRQGRPPLEPPQTVFGVTDLEIRQTAAEPQPAFIAAYLKWAPSPEEDTAPGSPAARGPGYRGYRVRDSLSLRRDRGDWVIDRLERLEAEPVEAPPAGAAGAEAARGDATAPR